ncbi:MAG TPA: DUF1194 domain-containing protein [Dongiaceae bacterium]|jgi:hypothetical protein|nr:DUF1194 domain-containing protein [Dongiaceae bacterium]
MIAAMSTAAIADDTIRQPVDLALVLLTDVSNSMDDREYSVVKEGYRAAFSDPDVIAAILSNSKGIAVAYVEFSGQDEFTIVHGWNVLSSRSSARSFGDAVAAAPRTSAGNTALAASLRKATELLSTGDLSQARRVIDVASDEDSDQGQSVPVRDAAVAAGITINALPFINDRPIGTYDGHMSYASAQWGLQSAGDFYRRDVIGGPGSFVIEVHDYNAFGEALKRKLLRELISSPGGTAQTFATNSY